MHTDRITPILGPDGAPLTAAASNGDAFRNGAPKNGAAKSMTGAITSYLKGLSDSQLPAISRAYDPFQNHAWVFAAATVISSVAAQPPMLVFRETEQEQRRRERLAIRSGRSFKSRAGKHRRAVQRHLRKSIDGRVLRKGLEPDLDHPIQDLLEKPNPYQNGQQFLALTYIWLAIQGEAFWIKTTEGGGPLSPGEQPQELWPIPPTMFSPRFEGGAKGQLVGWRMQMPSWFPGAEVAGTYLDLELHEVAVCKFPNPHTPYRGLSNLAAGATAIETDMLSITHQRSLLENQAVPKGILTYDGNMEPNEEAEYRKKWGEKFEGVENANRTAFLSNGFKYQTVGMSPTDMAFMESRNWNRGEILALMGVPPSVLGQTEFTNYATALAQERSFYDKTIRPMHQLVESTLDSEVMATETDDVVVGHDLSTVEALRAGISEKIDQVKGLVSQDIHCPPRTAFSVVGLEVPEYEGDEVAFVGALATPVEDVLSGDAPEVNPPPIPGQDDGSEETPEDSPDEEIESPEDSDEDLPSESTERSAPAYEVTKSKQDRRRRRIAAQFLRVAAKHERKMRRAYRSWVREQRVDVFRRFDQVATETAGRSFWGDSVWTREFIDLSKVLPSLFESANKLREKTRPTHAGILADTFDFTVESDLGGVPVFHVDDQRILDVFLEREQFFTRSTPKTVRENLRRELSIGMQDAETVQQLRLRVARVFDIEEGSARSLTIARTETAASMNDLRERMFDMQELHIRDWTTAQDEAVRDSHELFGQAEPKPAGFDYLTLLDRPQEGRLRHPNDIEGPARETINCRCVHIAVG